MVLNRIQEVKIYWSNPVALDKIENSRYYRNKEGLYIVSTRYMSHGVEREKIIYVGETLKGYDIRFEQHQDERKQSPWVKVRGRKYVRFGRISHTPGFVNDKKWFNLTLESAIIQTIKDKIREGVKLVNSRQVKKYTIYFDVEIHNIHKPAPLPSVIQTRDLYDRITNYDEENIIGTK